MVSAGTELVPLGVPAVSLDVAALEPVKVGALTVPVGVIVSEPPVVPTSPAANVVPRSTKPFSALACVKPAGQEPDATMTITPDGSDEAEDVPAAGRY